MWRIRTSISTLALFALAAMRLHGQTARPAEEEILTEKMFIDASREKVLGNTDEAIYLYNEVLRKDKDNHAAFFELARLYEIKKDGDKALENAEKAAKLKPDNVFYVELYAQMFENEGKYSEAAKAYEPLVKTHPNNIDMQMQLADYFKKSSQYDQAIKIYNNLENKFGLSKDISVQKYHTWVAAGKFSKAGNELENYINAYPNDYYVYEILANFYTQQNQQDKAFSVYQRLAKVAPDDPRANLHMAEYYRSQGDDIKYLNTIASIFDHPSITMEDQVKALLPYVKKLSQTKDPALQQALKPLGKKLAFANPGEAEARTLNGDILYYCGEFVKAKDEYTFVVQRSPEKLDVWQNLLRACAAIGNNTELLNQSREMMDLFPNQPEGFFFYGLANIRAANYNEASGVLQTALIMSNNNPSLKTDISAALAVVYFRQNNPDKAKETFEKAIAYQPVSAFALSEYARMLAERGDGSEKATDMAGKANALSPHDPEIQAVYAWTLYKNKNYREAKKWFENAIADSTEPSSELLERYGDTLYRLDQTEDARKYWQRALERGSHSDLLDKKVSTGKLVE